MGLNRHGIDDCWFASYEAGASMKRKVAKMYSKTRVFLVNYYLLKGFTPKAF
jgi:hypothetical protein